VSTELSNNCPLPFARIHSKSSLSRDFPQGPRIIPPFPGFHICAPLVQTPFWTRERHSNLPPNFPQKILVGWFSPLRPCFSILNQASFCTLQNFPHPRPSTNFESLYHPSPYCVSLIWAAFPTLFSLLCEQLRLSLRTHTSTPSPSGAGWTQTPSPWFLNVPFSFPSVGHVNPFFPIIYFGNREPSPVPPPEKIMIPTLHSLRRSTLSFGTALRFPLSTPPSLPRKTLQETATDPAFLLRR